MWTISVCMITRVKNLKMTLIDRLNRFLTRVKKLKITFIDTQVLGFISFCIIIEHKLRFRDFLIAAYDWCIFLPEFCLIQGAQLRKHIDATLGSGNLREAVRLPPGEDPNEWLAVNSNILFWFLGKNWTIFFYHDIVMLDAIDLNDIFFFLLYMAKGF